MLEWLDERSPRLAAVYCWFYNRLSGSRCFAQGCGRRVIWHTPRQWNRCLDTPLAIELTDRGWPTCLRHRSGLRARRSCVARPTGVMGKVQ